MQISRINSLGNSISQANRVGFQQTNFGVKMKSPAVSDTVSFGNLGNTSHALTPEVKELLEKALVYLDKTTNKKLRAVIDQYTIFLYKEPTRLPNQITEFIKKTAISSEIKAKIPENTSELSEFLAEVSKKYTKTNETQVTLPEEITNLYKILEDLRNSSPDKIGLMQIEAGKQTTFSTFDKQTLKVISQQHHPSTFISSTIKDPLKANAIARGGLEALTSVLRTEADPVVKKVIPR